MRTLKRVTVYLMEDVVKAGIEEREYVPHNFSTDQTFDLIIGLLRELNIILDPQEMSDRMEDLEKALLSLKSCQGTASEDRARLKIHAP